eukprot:GILI01016237.1.p1 GENE.GILI01016237.1~~GILI01016237.1.p1  ORF type:complete len:292 (+),score=77.82 GILI01016237.1:91-966(+)
MAAPLTDVDRKQLADTYSKCLETVATAAAATPANIRSPSKSVTLVAVSKTHPAPVLQAVYDAGCRVFGENYTYEIIEKAPQLPQDIDWHFIGHLQSNKTKELLTAVPSLAVIETVDSEKLAKKLNEGVKQYRVNARPLGVMVQVNTSGEESKSGLEPGSASTELAAFIVKSCPNLIFRGFMTIGMPDYTSRPENFECLRKVRDEAAAAIGLDPAALELSMGMSGDFVNAVAMGSTNVRVGTGIFGKRNYPIPEDAIIAAAQEAMEAKNHHHPAATVAISAPTGATETDKSA